MKIIVFLKNIIICILIIYYYCYIKLLKYIKTSKIDTINYKDKIINNDFFRELIEPVLYYEKLKGKNIRNIIIKDLAKFINIENRVVAPLIKFTEMMHNAALVIDDIQDNSLIRRNNPCAHIKYGIPYSMAGAYSQVFRLLYEMSDENKYKVDEESSLFNFGWKEFEEYCKKVREQCEEYRNLGDNAIKLIKKNELLNITIENLYKAHIGQGMEVYWTFKKKIPSVEEYFVMVEYKTSIIFKNIIDAINVYSRMSREDLDRYQEIFKNFGIFFQIRDDYINITSPDFWKEKGFCEDFDEKKYSYIIISFWKTIGEKERGKFIELFHKNNLTIKEKIKLLKMINKTNIFDKVYDELVEYKNELEKYSFFSSVWDKLPFYKFDIENCYKL